MERRLEPLEMKAEQAVVLDLMKQLQKALETFCDTYHKEVPFLDAFMAVHNFHKGVVLDLIARVQAAHPDENERQIASLWLNMAQATWEQALQREWEKWKGKEGVNG